MLGIFFCFAFQGKTQTFDSLSFTTPKGAFVQLKGKTKGLYRGRLDSVFVKIYVGNKAVYGNYFNRGNFEINLPLNEKLTLEINRKGYYPKRINVNTYLPETEKKPYFLIFEFFLVEKRTLKGLDDFILDFPTGIIEYNTKQKSFAYAEKYTKKMFKEINKLIDEAAKREESAIKK